MRPATQNPWPLVAAASVAAIGAAAAAIILASQHRENNRPHSARLQPEQGAAGTSREDSVVGHSDDAILASLDQRLRLLESSPKPDASLVSRREAQGPAHEKSDAELAAEQTEWHQ